MTVFWSLLPKFILLCVAPMCGHYAIYSTLFFALVFTMWVDKAKWILGGKTLNES